MANGRGRFGFKGFATQRREALARGEIRPMGGRRRKENIEEAKRLRAEFKQRAEVTVQSKAEVQPEKPAQSPQPSTSQQLVQAQKGTGFEDDAFARRIADSRRREQEFFGSEGFQRIERVSGVITGGGAVTLEERDPGIGRLSQRVVSGFAGLPFNLAGAGLSTGEKIGATIEGLSKKENRQNTIAELNRASERKEFRDTFDPRTEKGQATFISAGISAGLMAGSSTVLKGKASVSKPSAGKSARTQAQVTQLTKKAPVKVKIGQKASTQLKTSQGTIKAQQFEGTGRVFTKLPGRTLGRIQTKVATKFPKVKQPGQKTFRVRGTASAKTTLKAQAEGTAIRSGDISSAGKLFTKKTTTPFKGSGKFGSQQQVTSGKGVTGIKGTVKTTSPKTITKIEQVTKFEPIKGIKFTKGIKFKKGVTQETPKGSFKTQSITRIDGKNIGLEKGLALGKKGALGKFGQQLQQPQPKISTQPKFNIDQGSLFKTQVEAIAPKVISTTPGSFKLAIPSSRNISLGSSIINQRDLGKDLIDQQTIVDTGQKGKGRQGFTSSFIQSQTTGQTNIPAITTIQDQELKQVPEITTITTPAIPFIRSGGGFGAFGVVPFLPAGGLGSRTRKGKRRRQPKARTPSLFSKVFDITGKRSRFGEISGLGFRPILAPKKKKKRRKK